jgi:hypothetical protein
MPLDPSIISNAFADVSRNMPDMNALMLQRVQGAENIYQIETGRQEQAKADAKAQENAAVEALFPAYSYVLETGDLAGGLELAPPQYRDVLIPHMKALEGRSLPEIRAALTGSLVTSETGRALLENRSRAATLGVQQGQLDVSRQNVVLQRQKQQLDARGDGDWSLEPGVDEQGRSVYMWVNPRTRQIEPVRFGGGAVSGAVPGPTPIPAPDAAMPGAIPAPGAPETAQPAGAVQQPTFRPVPKDGKTSENERTAAYNAGRTLLSAADIFNTVKSDPDAIAPGALEAAVGLFIDPNFIRSADRQIVSSAQYEAVDALLTLATGAAYNQEQRASQIQRFIPLYSDKPKTREYKKRALLDTIQVAKVKSGYAWTPEMDVALEKLGLIDDTNAAAPPAAPTALPEGATTTNW